VGGDHEKTEGGPQQRNYRGGTIPDTGYHAGEGNSAPVRIPQENGYNEMRNALIHWSFLGKIKIIGSGM